MNKVINEVKCKRGMRELSGKKEDVMGWSQKKKMINKERREMEVDKRGQGKRNRWWTESGERKRVRDDLKHYNVKCCIFIQ